MTRLTVKEAGERLPELLNEGARGEEIVIDGDGASYKVTVVALEIEKRARRASEEESPPFAALRGAGGGKSFRTAEEVNTYIRSLRDEWES